MDYLFVKSLHIIFVVTWFSGLFYIVRLFIYHVEAEKKEPIEKTILQRQYKIMEKRLWYFITCPSAILASFFAFYLLYLRPQYLEETWMLVKLSIILMLYLYHYSCHRIFKKLQNDICKYNSTFLRLWNEMATLILFSIVFLVVLKNNINWIWMMVAVLFIFFVLLSWIVVYVKKRKK